MPRLPASSRSALELSGLLNTLTILSARAPPTSSCHRFASSLNPPRFPRATYTHDVHLEQDIIYASARQRLGAPPYPFGERRVYKQSNTGLYGNARLQYGNNVAPKHNTKTPRRWKVNVHRKKLYSQGLGRWVRTKATAAVLRTIDKLGGLDEYLLGDKAARIKELGPAGWKLRWRLLQEPKIRVRLRRERIAMGLPAQVPWLKLAARQLHEVELASAAEQRRAKKSATEAAKRVEVAQRVAVTRLEAARRAAEKAVVAPVVKEAEAQVEQAGEEVVLEGADAVMKAEIDTALDRDEEFEIGPPAGEADAPRITKPAKKGKARKSKA